MSKKKHALITLSPFDASAERRLRIDHDHSSQRNDDAVAVIAEWDAIDEDELIEKFGATDLECSLARVFLALCRDVSAAMEVSRG